MPRPPLAALKQKIARMERTFLSFGEETRMKFPLGHAGADAALQGGIARGALHEIYASERDAASGAAFAAMLALRTAAPEKVLLWVRQDFIATQCGLLSAQGLLDLGLNPDRLLLVHMKNAASALRAASDALSCKALGAVVLELWGQPKALDLAASQKFARRSAQSAVTLFVVRIAAREISPSTAETRWLVRADRVPDFVGEWGNPRFEATLARNRHGQTGSWAMEWNCDACVFREAPQNSRPLVPQPVRRPHQADAETERRSAAG